MPDDELHKIGYENAMRWYHFDPFARRSRDQSTVAALRAGARGHDVSERSYDKGRREKQVGIEIGELAARATA